MLSKAQGYYICRVNIKVLPDQQSSLSKKEQVEQMFDSIAGKYDFLNRLLSLRIDVLWRNKVVKLLKPYQPKLILDVATGTADLALTLMKLNPTKIVGLDLSQNMLNIGQQKIDKLGFQNTIELVKGDGENLPFESNSFDAVTVAFGVRNFEHLEPGLREIYRVLKPGGQFIILEFSKVKTFPLKQFYYIYFSYITPAIGKLFSKDSKAYTYLPNSVKVFPEGEELCVILQQSGFKQTICKPQSFGIASIYQSVK
ncbi:MAG: bifunctional demethylmenaquinone methyltransferase/2-methoxy-6-polyprenyl-1,4-benzoquinol methylase UbiE [Bacteroidetes bacterium]|nr:bifunctional demethylmenaquinone methyltransferase/2-methoxy-6-polyprenyl-1,4-benzoquinol methylase UbiE [Bacteroidota bacterium]